MALSDDEFRIRIGKSGRDDGAALGRVRGAVKRANTGSGRSKPALRTGPPRGVRPHVRPAKASNIASASTTSRRVVVKARIVPHGGGASSALKAHVSYLARETKATRAPEQALGEEHAPASGGLERQVDYLSRDDAGVARNSFYDSAAEGVDAKALTAGWSKDLRHFRFIISAEDGAALGDLKPFVREVMGDLEQRLGVGLEWVAADHWDTDNPHSHVLVRGKTRDGADLVIPRRVISHEIRERAQGIVTRTLGPRIKLDHEIAQDRALEAKAIAAPRLTPLDREILSKVRYGLVEPPRGRVDIAQRLERLEAWDLAARQPDGRWAIASNLVTNLKALGERREICDLLARVEGLALAEYDILPADPKAPVVGRLVQTGVLDELSDRTHVVLENAQGQLVYAGFDKAQDLAVLEGAVKGAILELAPASPRLRPSDEAVARIADLTDGVYSMEQHLLIEPHADRALIEGNVRRLEAMRRANMVERSPDGVFQISADHLDKALVFETRQVTRAPFNLRAVSYWTLAEQERAFGATQLDQVLAGEAHAPKGMGKIGRDFEAALQRRRLFLIEQGYLGAGASVLSRDALRRLSLLELERTARALERDIGLPVLTHHQNRLEGVYARRIDLAQGRMALIVRNEVAHLVEWRPALEQFAGRQVQGIARGRSIAWSLAKGRSINLPMM